MSKKKQSNFILTEPILDCSKDGEFKVWSSLKQVFSQRECLAYWRYPLFARVGEIRKEPDILIVDRELGVIVIEIASIPAEEITSIGEYAEVANRQLQALLGYCDREPSIFRKVRGRTILALPFITEEQAQQAGINLTDCSTIIWQNQLEISNLFNYIYLANSLVNGEELSQEQWNTLLGVISGTPVLRKQPRPQFFPPQKSRSKVLSLFQEKLYELDIQQEEVAKQIPPGVQRIRGIAGSGKTVLLCQKAANMHLKHPEWDIALVFFTRSLYEQIETLLDRWLRRFSNGDVWYKDKNKYNQNVKNKLRVLHAWGGQERSGLYSTICTALNVKPLAANETKDLKPNEGLARACQQLLDEEEIPQLFDAIVIDEGQDLVTGEELKYYDENTGEYKQAIYWLAYQSLRPVENQGSEQKRLIWAYDEAQNLDNLKIPGAKELFGESLSNLIVGKHPGDIPKSVIMYRCYRTPGPILAAAHAIGMGLLRPEGMLSGLTDQKSWNSVGYEVTGDFRKMGSEITLHRPGANSYNPLPSLWTEPVLEFQTYTSRQEELEGLIERVKYNLNEDGFKPSQDILVIVLGSALEKEVAQFLSERGVKIYIPSAGGLNQIYPKFGDRGYDRDRFWYEGGVTVSQVQRAKGNEANIVYVVGLDRVAQNESDINLRNRVFVALTRTRGWAYLSGAGNYPLYDEVRKVIASGDTFTFTFNRPPTIDTGEQEN
jgi:superfamily I DNA and RNA helicase